MKLRVALCFVIFTACVGCASREAHLPSYRVTTATPSNSGTNATYFGVYDKLMTEAIRERWYDLLERQSKEGYKPGKVVLHITLEADGKITELKMIESNVPEAQALACQRAVLDPAPFDRWPKEMTEAVGSESRKITFTFYYNQNGNLTIHR